MIVIPAFWVVCEIIEYRNVIDMAAEHNRTMSGAFFYGSGCLAQSCLDTLIS
jgi:heme/copper-type cytochrome/quinol oxidase subunit 3